MRSDAVTHMDTFGVSSSFWAGTSRSFLEQPAPAGSYDPALDNFMFGLLKTLIIFELDGQTDWTIHWNPDAIQEKVTKYRDKRSQAITELQEKVSRYEQFNDQ